MKPNEPSTSSQNNKIELEITKNKTDILEDKRKLYPDLNLPTIGPCPAKSGVIPKTDVPKIIDAIPKTADISKNEEKPHNAASTSDSVQKTEKTGIAGDKPEKHSFNEVVTQTITTVLYAPKLEKEESEDLEYDVKTLRPNRVTKEWECHLCTLLNPLNSNICGVCATVSWFLVHIF